MNIWKVGINTLVSISCEYNPSLVCDHYNVNQQPILFHIAKTCSDIELNLCSWIKLSIIAFKSVGIYFINCLIVVTINVIG